MTPTVREKAVAIGTIQGAKPAPSAYKIISRQVSFSYDTIPRSFG